MKRILTIAFAALLVLAAGHAISAQQQAFGGAQLAVPEIPFDSVPNFLKLPDKMYLGEVPGVATNSKGHVFVYTRTGTMTATLGGRAFTHSGSRLFEFDEKGAYVRRSASASTGSCSHTSSALTRRTTSGSSTRPRTS
jgi:hypothetical protein